MLEQWAGHQKYEGEKKKLTNNFIIGNTDMVSAINKKEMDLEKPRRWKQKQDRLHPDQ